MTERPLTLHDRCDRCGAQAFTRILVGESELLFCGHHYGRHANVLSVVCTEVYDYRDLINKAPSPSV